LLPLNWPQYRNDATPHKRCFHASMNAHIDSL
jgi:hypothetical protein